MGMFPCPHARTLFALHNFAVLLTGAHKRHIAVVHLRRAVDKVKHARGSRNAHYDRVYLLGNLVYITRKLFCHIEEGHYNAYGYCHARKADVQNVEREEYAADDRENYIQHVAYVEERGRQHIGIPVGAAAGVVQPFVYLVEARLRRLFMAECLYHLLAGEHLFDIALLLAYRLLLLNEIARAAAAYLFGYDEHNGGTCKHDQSKPQAVVEHDKQHRKHRYA